MVNDIFQLVVMAFYTVFHPKQTSDVKNLLSALLLVVVIVCLRAFFAYLIEKIAEGKGYSKTLFWLFGFFLLIPAYLTVVALPNKTKQKALDRSAAAEEGIRKELTRIADAMCFEITGTNSYPAPEVPKMSTQQPQKTDAAEPQRETVKFSAKPDTSLSKSPADFAREAESQSSKPSWSERINKTTIIEIGLILVLLVAICVLAPHVIDIVKGL